MRQEKLMGISLPHVALFLETSLDYGRRVLRGIANYVVTHDPWSIYFEHRGLSHFPPGWLKKWDGHGIVIRAHTRQVAEFVAELGVPTVDTQHEFPELNLPAVIPDQTAVAQAAADHLLERHFRHFAFVGVERVLWSKMRQAAFVEILQKAGFPCHVYSPISRKRFLKGWEGRQTDLADWLEELPKPVAVMAAHDLRGLCILDACRRKCIAVPEQVAVIGVDNDETLSTLSDPPLSSVKLDFELIGFTAAELLDRLIQGKKGPKLPIAIKPLGVVTRRSTDVVAIEDPLTAQAVRYIRQHACNGISVADVALHCNTSRRVIERSLSQFLGTSPHEQIVRAKLAHAKQLLTETDYGLDTIAAKCSLNHATYMGVVFKREVGQTPGQYRRIAARNGHRIPTRSASVTPIQNGSAR